MAAARRRRQVGDLDVVVDGSGDTEPTRPEPWLPWWLASAAAGVLSVAISWVLVCGLFALGWLATTDIDFSGVFVNGTRVWLLGFFAGADVAGLHLTITPLGMTLGNLALALGLASFAAGQARLAAPEELSGHQRRNLALRVAAVFTLAHTLAVLVPSFFVATAEQSARAMVGALAIGAIAALVVGARGFQWRVTEDWPHWLRPVPAGVGAAVLVMLTTGALVLAIGLISNRDRIVALHQALEPDTLGSILLLVLQLLWLPNLLVWCTSWALGSGFQVGLGSVVSPAQNQLGLLPSIPVLGALPETGPGSSSQLWWLASGLLAGAIGALVVLRARPRARFDETALVGGLVGVLAGLVLVALGMLSSGDLGTGRLVDLGVRPTALFVMAPTLLGIAGVVTGAVTGLLRRPAAPAEPDPDDSAAAVDVDPTDTSPDETDDLSGDDDEPTRIRDVR
ncbi:DUF6350 family protein [Propionibacteriaceae bacterium Y1923]